MIADKAPGPSWADITQLIATIPLFAPYRVLTSDLGEDWPSIATLNEAATAHAPHLALEFIPQKPTSRRKRDSSSTLRGYIQQIAEDNLVPMRPKSVHDLFNYLTFLLFPESKKALMRIHHAETMALLESTNGVGPKGGRGRTRTQDLATLFDEGGSIAYGTQPDDLIVFGHGILEQFILQPRQVRAFCWNISSETFAAHDTAAMDQKLAEILVNAAHLADSSQFSGQYIPESLTVSLK